MALALVSDKGALSFLYRRFMRAAPGGGLPDHTVKRKICIRGWCDLQETLCHFLHLCNV
jgi:hypothetical protein